eukprot:Phypoly_transcript_08023.p1 GENE.Phypoly_transcript_08023~~Phypoly_transcript_08023.p1  ORF type:complete len:445 (+),score=102.83 Phypoly_transcript_08023:178-1512(+)
MLHRQSFLLSLFSSFCFCIASMQTLEYLLNKLQYTEMSGFKDNLSAPQAETLKAFHARLGADLAPFQEEGKPVVLWGVELITTEPAPPKVDVILLKFLRAREFKVEEAATMLVNCIKWRKEFGIDHIFEEKFPHAITSLGFIHKTDNQGRPVMYNIYGNIRPKEAFEDQGGIDKFVRWRVQLMEKAILRLDMETVEDMVILHDYEGVSMLSMDKNTKQASRTLIALFQDYYPELLAKKFFVNIPWFFETVYNVISAFVSDRTKAKFVLCSKGSLREKLLVNIPVENLPTEYGGLSTLDKGLIPHSPNINNNNNNNNPTNTNEPPQYTSAEKPTEVNIEPGAKYEVAKEVEAGQVLVWEFTLVTSDILFSVAQENSGAQGEKPNVVVAPRRVEQHAGTHVATEKGKFVLTWENSSTFFGKKLRMFYKVFVADPQATQEAPKEEVD